MRALAAIALAVAIAPVTRLDVARGFQPRDRGPERAALQLSPPQRTEILDNPTAAVTRLRFAPGAAETVLSHAFPILIVQLTPGTVDLTVSDARARGPREAGLVTLVPANVPYAAANAGTTSFDLIAIMLKPDRPAAPAAPPTQAPPGITRTTLLDNADARVVRVEFAPGSREPIHTHPNDLLTVQLSAGKVEILNGSKRTKGRRAIGFVQFLPRDVSHAYVSTDRRLFDLLSVFIK